MSLEPPRCSLRLLLVCAAALAISFPIAWISLSKLFMSLLFLALTAGRLRASSVTPFAWDGYASAAWTSALVLLMGASLLTTVADGDTATESLIKHSKLLFILVPALLLRTRTEALWALRVFALGQCFLMVCSWLLSLDVALPWATQHGGRNVVFSTYLDQSMMLASGGAIFWHLRDSGAWPRWLGILAMLSAAAIVLFLLEGRTGYVLVVGLAALALAWSCPLRWRRYFYAVAALLVLACAAWGYLHAQRAPLGTDNEERVYVQPGNGMSSDSWRVNAWRLSLQAGAQAPLLGHGVGSWMAVVTPLQGASAAAVLGTSNISNPHEEYLLWTVEFGVLGLLGLLAWFFLVARDAARFAPPVTQALWSVLGACAVAGLFNSVLYDDLIGDFFCICLGLLFALGLHSPPQKVQPL